MTFWILLLGLSCGISSGMFYFCSFRSQVCQDAAEILDWLFEHNFMASAVQSSSGRDGIGGGGGGNNALAVDAYFGAAIVGSSGGGTVSGGGGGGGTSSNSATSVTVNREPHFDATASKNVTALLGKTAYLNCRVKNLANRTVSWVRHRDVHLLTVGRYTYTNDQRFRAIHQPHSEDWTLQIKYPQHRDSGVYECQVSSSPPLSHFIHLTVIEPDTEIVGGPELFIDRGSTINLTCVVRHSPEPPAYIFWNHNDAIISYASARGGVSVATERGETSRSVLLIQKARPTDSGNYQCNPSNARPANVTVHVLNGEHPEAMQHGGNQRMGSSVNIFALLIILLLTTHC